MCIFGGGECRKEIRVGTESAWEVLVAFYF